MRRTYVAVIIVNAACVVCALMFLMLCRSYFPKGDEAFVEESYTTFRYARNLADGHGFVWNQGDQPVMGVTDLAWVFGLVEAGRAVDCDANGADITTGDAKKADANMRTDGMVNGVLVEMVVAPVLGVAHVTVAMFAGAFAVLLLVRRRYRWLALLVPLNMAVNPYFAWHASTGLETSQAICFLSVLLMLSAIYLKRPGLFGITGVSLWGALGSLVRPDMTVPVIVLLVTLVVMGARRGRFRAVWAAVVALSAPVAVGGGLLYMKWTFFGTVLSPSVFITGGFFENLFHPGRFAFGYAGGFLLLAAPYLLLIGFGIAVRARRAMGPERAWLPAVAAGILYFVVVIPANGFGYRFMMPMWPVIVVLAAVALGEGIHFLRNHAAHHRRVVSTIVTVAVVLLFVGYSTHLCGTVRDNVREQYSQYDDLRELAAFLREFKTYLATAEPEPVGVVAPAKDDSADEDIGDRPLTPEDIIEIIRLSEARSAADSPERPESDRPVVSTAPVDPLRPMCLATTEPGVLGYLSGWKTIDMVGWNSPGVAKHYRTKNLPAEFVMRPKPDLIFMPDREFAHVADALRAHPDFAHYRPIGSWRKRVYHGLIMVKKGSPLLEELVRFLELRRQYLHDNPEDAVEGRACKYMQAYRLTRESKPGNGE